MTIGKDFGERVSLSVTGLNVGNRRVLLDNSFHVWRDPFQQSARDFRAVALSFSLLRRR